MAKQSPLGASVHIDHPISIVSINVMTKSVIVVLLANLCYENEKGRGRGEEKERERERQREGEREKRESLAGIMHLNIKE